MKFAIFFCDKFRQGWQRFDKPFSSENPTLFKWSLLLAIDEKFAAFLRVHLKTPLERTSFMASYHFAPPQITRKSAPNLKICTAFNRTLCTEFCVLYLLNLFGRKSLVNCGEKCSTKVGTTCSLCSNSRAWNNWLLLCFAEKTRKSRCRRRRRRLSRLCCCRILFPEPRMEQVEQTVERTPQTISNIVH